jgi:serine/threonine protein kinase
MDRISLLRDIRSRQPDASFAEIVPACKPESHGSLVELACIDLIDRQRSGASVRVEEYVAAVPALNNPDDVLELIDAEVCVRQELRTPANREELLSRFPQHASAIERMFVLDELEAQLRPPARARERLPQIAGYQLTNQVVSDTTSATFRAIGDDKAVRLVRLFGEGSRNDQRLVSAIKSAAALQHPAILAIQQVSAEDERIYYAMPFTDGTPLRSLIARPVDTKQTAPWLRTIATTIAFAESQGVSLGIIQAEQVLIDHHDQARVLGFGQPISGSDGTEQLDQFGRLFFEVLTNTTFSGEQAAIHQLSVLSNSTDTALTQICTRCLGLGSTVRYGGMGDVVDTLTDFVSGRTSPTQAKPGFFSKLLRKK